MKLDRNSGRGKYAVVRLRNVNPGSGTETTLEALATGGFVEFGKPGSDDEFFVIKLKDEYAPAALFAYAAAARVDDTEYADEIVELAKRAQRHPGRKKPD